MPVTFPTLSSGYSVQQDGTLIVWGTDGILQSPFPPVGSTPFAGTGFYIVVSSDEAEKVDLDYGENGAGVEMRRTIIKHGQRWNMTVIDDLQFPAPGVGTTVTIVDVLSGPASLANGTATYNTKVATIIDNNVRNAQKQAGQRVLQIEYINLIGS